MWNYCCSGIRLIVRDKLTEKKEEFFRYFEQPPSRRVAHNGMFVQKFVMLGAAAVVVINVTRTCIISRRASIYFTRMDANKSIALQKEVPHYIPCTIVWIGWNDCQ